MFTIVTMPTQSMALSLARPLGLLRKNGAPTAVAMFSAAADLLDHSYCCFETC